MQDYSLAANQNARPLDDEEAKVAVDNNFESFSEMQMADSCHFVE